MRMRPAIALTAVVAASTLGLAACGSTDDESPSASPSATDAMTEPSPSVTDDAMTEPSPSVTDDAMEASPSPSA